MSDLKIPEDHWRDTGFPNWRGFVTPWEKMLRSNLAAEPDPAKRFEVWLDARAAGLSGPGVRLVFIEQPYLAWAETVDRIIAATNKATRASIAREITDDDED